ncbi:MAG: hypothetical protein KQH67_07315 [Bacteroidetes bacterium]|nr:hypothetical protein [Bacteroidota bacterium]
MNNQQKLQGVPPVWVFSISNLLRNFFKKLFYAFVPSNMAVFEKSQGFWIAKAISVACELNLAEIVGNTTKNIEEIADKAGANKAALYRLMRALASEGIFKETETRNFKNTPLSNALREQPGHLKNMIMHQLNSTNWEVVNEMKYSVITGQNAAQKLFGSDIFTHLENTPEKNALYNKAMTETSRLSSASIASAYSFRNINTLTDLGGGEGMLLYTILQKNEKIKGILFDLPHVVATAAQLAKDYHVENRVQIIPGSFFKDNLPDSDAYLLKNILHAFDDATCISLLKSIHRAMTGKGKILVVEAVVGENNKAEFGKMFDLQMLIGTENGKERTKNEFRNIFEAAGFRLNRVIKTVSPFCIVEGVKI